jgi:DNA polymerase-3 subunit chi
MRSLAAIMTEVLFYHLERARAEDVLPQLVQRSLERGWRAVVQSVSEERVEQLSRLLWTWADDEFLAHGTASDGHAELQPIWLTPGNDTPNAATVRILVDGAQHEGLDGLDRLVIMFDGADEAAVSAARQKWKQVTAVDGVTATYWQQDERGRWVKKATAGEGAATNDQ